MSKPEPFRRPQAAELARRLAEPRRFIQVVAGPRQVGKTTLVQQVTEGAGVGVRFASADEPTLRGAEWVAEQSLAAIEVKSARRRDTLPGMEAFARAFRPTRRLLVGGDGIELEEFLLQPVEHWVKG